MYSFLRAAISKSNSLLNTELSNSDIQPFVDIMNYFMDQLAYIQIALKSAFMYSSL
jgi:hypothetical protein